MWKTTVESYIEIFLKVHPSRILYILESAYVLFWKYQVLISRLQKYFKTFKKKYIIVLAIINYYFNLYFIFFQTNVFSNMKRYHMYIEEVWVLDCQIFDYFNIQQDILIEMKIWCLFQLKMTMFSLEVNCLLIYWVIFQCYFSKGKHITWKNWKICLYK